MLSAISTSQQELASSPCFPLSHLPVTAPATGRQHRLAGLLGLVAVPSFLRVPSGCLGWLLLQPLGTVLGLGSVWGVWDSRGVHALVTLCFLSREQDGGVPLVPGPWQLGAKGGNKLAEAASEQG